MVKITPLIASILISLVAAQGQAQEQAASPSRSGSFDAPSQGGFGQFSGSGQGFGGAQPSGGFGQGSAAQPTGSFGGFGQGQQAFPSGMPQGSFSQGPGGPGFGGMQSGFMTQTRTGGVQPSGFAAGAQPSASFGDSSSQSFGSSQSGEQN